MDPTTATVLVVIIFAFVILAAIIVFRQVRAKVKGPFNTGLDLDASNQPPSAEASRPGIEASKLRSRKGGAEVVTQTGKDMKVEDVEVESDISIRDEQAEGPPDTKADPPA